MEKIYNTPNHIQFYLSVDNNIILFQYAKNRIWSSPMPLAFDFACNLSSAYYRDMLYYSYFNLQNDICVRCYENKEPLYIIPNPLCTRTDSRQLENLKCLNLIIAYENLLLFYISFNKLTSTYSIQCDIVLQASTQFVLDTHSPLPVSFDLIYVPYNLLLITAANDNFHFHQINNTFTCQAYETTPEIQLKEKNKKLESKIKSATLQYNELMQVAQKYRDEMLLWQSIFHQK